MSQPPSPAKPPDRSLPAAPGEERTPGWAERLVRLLDDGLRVPFTDWRFGLDGILGLFVPVAGDAITGFGSAAILLLALRQGVPTVVLARMVGNVAVDLVVGAIPFVGDLFDFAWKSNRRNLDLLERFRDPDAKAGAADYLILALGLLVAAAIVVVPILVLVWLGGTVTEWLGSLGEGAGSGSS